MREEELLKIFSPRVPTSGTPTVREGREPGQRRRIRATFPTRKRGADRAPKRRYARSPEHVCPKFPGSDTRAFLRLRSRRKRRSKVRNAPALQPGEVSVRDCRNPA